MTEQDKHKQKSCSIKDQKPGKTKENHNQLRRSNMRAKFMFSALFIAFLLSCVLPIPVNAQLTQGDHASVPFDNLSEVSPNDQYVAYVTADDLGMHGSTIWVSKPDGSEKIAVATGGDDFWVTNPVWSPDSRRIAYLKILDVVEDEFSVLPKFELWLVNADGSENTLLTDSSSLNPSLGYGGKTDDISWKEDNVIEFTDNAVFPIAQYAFHVTTGEIVKIGESLGGLEEQGLGRQASNVPYFNQCRGHWSGNRLGTCGTTICRAGCAMSNVAMVLRYYGANADPGSLNSWLTSHGGYQSGCLIRWGTAANYHSGTTFITYSGRNWGRLRAELNNGYPVIVRVNNRGGQHWVLVTHYSGNTYYINDPGYSSRKTLASYGNTFMSMVIYHGRRPSPTPSPRPAPRITGVSPNPMKPLPMSQRQPITITGNNFAPGAKLFFKITDSPGYSYPNRTPGFLNSNKIVYNISVGPRTYNWTVQVINPDGKASNVYPFQVRPQPSPPNPTPSGGGVLPVYRKWSQKRNDHLYTTNLHEEDNIYVYENTIIGYVYPTEVTGTVPVYRQWNARKQDHFYTTSEEERQLTKNTMGYVDEGILGYVYPTHVAGTQPVYRQFHYRKNDHFYTQSWGEHEYARDHIGYVDEGILGYFLAQPYSTLRVKKSGNGTGTVTASGIKCGSDCSKKYKAGAKVMLRAVPGTDAIFAGWQGACRGSETCTVTMLGDKTVTAVFQKKPYTIKASAGTGGKISPSGNVPVNPGANQTFTLTPDPGYKVVMVIIDGRMKKGISQYTFNAVRVNHSIRVYFDRTSHLITADAGPGGSITPSGNNYVRHGTEKTFSITPDAGYVTEDVKVDGHSVSPKTSYTFSNVTKTHTIVATFKRLTYTINASAASGGSISPAGVTEVNSGEDLTVTMTPQNGYQIAAILVDGEYKGDMSSYTFEHVAEDHHIKAFFKPGTTHTIHASAENGGSISPSGDVLVNEGTRKRFTIVPNNGYKIVDVAVDGHSIGAAENYTFTNITADHRIEASFAPDTVVYAITAHAGHGGAISPSGAVNVEQGSDKSFSITADTGYKIADVKVDGVSVGATATYRFTNVTAEHTIEANFEASQSVVLTLEDAEGKPGDANIPVPIALDNSTANNTPVSAMQFKLNYDATVGIQPTGSYKTTARLDGFTVSLVVNEDGANSNVFVLLNNVGGAISPARGTILEILFDVKEDAQPEAFSSLTITQAMGVDANAAVVPVDTSDSAAFTIIAACDKGDINCDGAINVIDIQLMTNCILGSGTCERCDINEDGQHNVLDLQLISKKIMNPGASLTGMPMLRGKPALTGTSKLSFPNLQLLQGTTGTFGIGLRNSDAVAAGQLTLSYDSTSGFDITDINVTERTNGFYEPVAFRKDDTDPSHVKVTVLFFSLTGAMIEAGTGDILEVSYQTSPDASGTPELTLTDTLLADQDGSSQAVTPENGDLTIDDPQAEYVVIVDKTGSGQGNVVSVPAPAGINCGESCTAMYPRGTEITLIATPEEGSEFVGWFGPCGGTEECVFTLESHEVVEAIFDIPKENYKIHADAAEGGSITPAGDVLVNRGQAQTFTMTPDDGYTVKDVTVDGASHGAITSYTFESVRADHTIEVVFKKASGNYSSFFNFDDQKQTWRDVNKSADNPDDDWMCWAAAAANILDWAGWGTEAFDTAQEIFSYFQDSWTNAGGFMKNGWKWWFDGSSPENQSGFATLNKGSAEAGDGGNYWSDYNFFDYYYEESANYDTASSLWSDGSGLMQSIDEYLHRGFGTTLAIYNGSSGHALTTWGYEYDEYGQYTGIWVSDSDDETNDLKRLSLLLDEDTNLWYLDSENLYNYSGWFIAGVQALAQNPQSAVPEPGTMLLIALGLLNLFVVVRKRRRQK